MTSIYHITHVHNLGSIVRQGGLYCDSIMAEKGIGAMGIAHSHIKQRRANKRVPTPCGGVVADYVPFYFAPRSPMLFSIYKGNVLDYNGSQEGIVHLVASAEQAAASAVPFSFTDGHAVMDISRFFTDLADLTSIDWLTMRSKYWNDTQQDGDRSRRRQAEFLVYQFAPWRLIDEIGVMTSRTAREVEAILASMSHRPPVSVRRQWYY